MSIFEHNKAIGITWSKEGCQIVKVGSNNGLLVVESVWSGTLGDDRSLAEVIADGVKAVNVKESDIVVAGGDGQGWETVDAVMPRLKSEELAAALPFEMRKKTPLPLEKLRWGYRVVNAKAGKNEELKLRIAFIRNEQWDRQIKGLGALKMADCLMPPAFCLDPLMADKTAYLPDGYDGWLEYSVGEDGRQIACCDAPTLEQALPSDVFCTDMLKARPDALNFVAAVILAGYALGDGFSVDVKTAIPMPAQLKSNRNAALKMTVAILAGYVILMIVYGIVASWQAKAAQLRRIDGAITSVRDEISLYNVTGKNDEKLNLLKQEMLDNQQKMPEFPMVLLELTKIVETSHWVSQAMDWKDGQISFVVQSKFKDMDLAARLEDSPIIGDVTERSSSFNQNTNTYSQRFDVMARYDDEEDRARLDKRRRDGKIAVDDGGEGDAEEIELTPSEAVELESEVAE